MTIKSKIYSSGIIMFIVFVFLALINIKSHQEIISNIRERDQANEKILEVEKFIAWKHNLVRFVSDSVAAGGIHRSAVEVYKPPSKLWEQQSFELINTGKILVDLIAEKEKGTEEIERKFNQLHHNVNVLYSKLDREISTALARAQMNQVLGIDNTESNFVAPFILKSLNQLTSLALNSLINMNYAGADIIDKNKRLIRSQISILDPTGDIHLLFKRLFKEIDIIKIFIIKSNQRIKLLDAKIAVAKKNFYHAVDRSETDSIVRQTREELARANRKLEKTSQTGLFIIISVLFIGPIVIIVIGTFGLNTLVVKPIFSLIEFMKDVEAGKFNVTAPVKTKDEIGRLAGAFNLMTAEINNKIRELSILNEELLQSESKYKTLVNNLPQKIFLKNRKSIYISCNKNYAQSLKIDEEDITGKSDFDFFSKKLAQKYIHDDLTIIKEGKNRDFEEVYLENGKEIIVQTIKVPVYNENGIIDGVLGIFWDITEKKKAEKEVKKARSYISNIINSMPSVIIGVDKKGIVTHWNNKAVSTLNLSQKEATGQPLDKLLPWFVQKMDGIKKLYKTNQVYTELKQSRKVDNEIIFEDITVYPLISNGAAGAVIRIDDVTEKVRLEEMMIQSEKMLSVGGLAAGMAHEINNPLAGILQTIYVMENRLRANSTIPANIEAAKEAGTKLSSIEKYLEIRDIFQMIKRIVESGRRVAEIVNNMLSFSRKSDSTLSVHNIEELLDKTLELASVDYDLKKKYDFRKIKIIKEYNGNKQMVASEPGKLQQVFLNLLRNAAQSMQFANTKNPRIMIRTGLSDNRKTFIIEIEDNGPGMTEEVSKRVFEPFFTTKQIGIGTGLGLSVSYFIITENHNGNMFVKSEPGKGTKFIIHLPAGYESERK